MCYQELSRTFRKHRICRRSAGVAAPGDHAEAGQGPDSLGNAIPDATAVAPATYNTINKWALGISDTYALGVLAEQTALGMPLVVLPFVNAALASRAPFQQSVKSLRAEGVSILLGPGAIEPHQPHTGGSLLASYPWHLALDEVDSMTGTADEDPDPDA
jgi:hypothetical protein